MKLSNRISGVGEVGEVIVAGRKQCLVGEVGRKYMIECEGHDGEQWLKKRLQ